MAKKQAPLKDESIYSVDDICSKLDEILDAIKNKNIQKAHELLSGRAGCNWECVTDSAKFNTSVTNAMDTYLKSHQVKIVENGEESVIEKLKTLLEDYRTELVQIKEKPATPAVTLIDKNVVEAAVTTVVGRGDTHVRILEKPVRPALWKYMPSYLFFCLPYYYLRTFFASPYVHRWFKIVMFCVWLTSIFLTCIIAHDNARLNTIEKKYVLLREFARPNKEWAEKADYIEFLYTDEAEHQEEIHRLWENRHKRLGCR